MTAKEELRKQIIQFLQVMSEGENIIQCIKEALVMHEEFSPIVLFETISKGKNKCSKSDLKAFLQKQSVQFNNEELRGFMKQNRLNKEITFHEFVDSIMPFNADALRVYKQSYLQKLAIREQDAEVQLLYRELLENQFKFIRSIDMIKNQILVSCKSQIWKVNQLIKNDLVGKSKIRESKKFEQKFQNPTNEISFIDLRRFLQLHAPTHEVVLLNLMRKLRTDNPLKPINLGLEKGLKSLSKSKSRNHSKQLGGRSKSRPKLQNSNGYDNFKKQLQQQYQASLNSTSKINKSGKSQTKLKKNVEIRFERQKKNTDGNLIKKLLQTIISKQQILQKQRKKLFSCKQFNMINLFKLIDINNNGVLNEQDITRFVNKYSSGSKADFDVLVQTFAKQQGLRFHELYLILQPLSKDLIKTIANKQQDPIPNPFKQKTISLIIEILTQTTQALEQIKYIKQQINDKGQNIDQLFSYINVKNRNYITNEDIKQLLQEDEFFTDQKDMKLLFKYLDKKIDDKIQLWDFKKLVEL